MSRDEGANRLLDGVDLAVLANRFEGIVRRMMNTLVRTGRSIVLNTGRDFSCCILTRENDLLTIAESLPIHIVCGPDIMSKAMTDLQPLLRRGDAFLHNSPYHGNSHAADYSILVPVIDTEVEHRFTVFAKAHQADCGNPIPTTYMTAARDVYEEGALLFPCVKVQENYADCDDIIRMCKLRIRVPEQWWGDYLALLGAARIGEREVLALGEEYGWQALDRYTQQWFDYSEELMVNAIRRLPSGRAAATTAHDPFPNVPEGIPVNVLVDVKSEEGLIEVDLRDNADCQPCGLNLSEATARTAAIIGVLNSLGTDTTVNAGGLRRLRIHLRNNCVVGIPRHPASCSVATTNLADRVTNAVQRAIGELADGFGLAEAGLVFPPAVAVISGRDERLGGSRFINEVHFSAVTGGPGGPAADGWLMLLHPGSAGMGLRDSVELNELRFPMRVYAQHIIPDSEGAGAFRGAPGARVEYGPIGSSLQVVFLSDGCVNPALGVRGGLNGAPARQFKRTAPGELIGLDPITNLVLEPGETVVSISCGGGGYGSAIERDPELVRHDVIERWISPERAERVYGVALDDSAAVDAAKTARLRKRLRSAVDVL